MSTIGVILDQVARIPPMPQARVRLLFLTMEPDFDIDEVVKVVLTDPGITAHVLRHVNSVRRGLLRKVATVQEAIPHLGARELRILILANCCGRYFRYLDGGYELVREGLWHHSVGCAFASQSLAESTARVSPELAFSAGLLHDLGKIALNEALKAHLEQITDYAGGQSVSFLEAEKMIIGFDHGEAGGILGTRWQLPRRLITVMRHHHAPSAAPSHQELVDTIHIADLLAYSAGVGLGIDGLSYRLDEQAVARQGISEAHMALARLAVVEGVRETSEMLKAG
ncbi:MAG: HDOD domain-containing protein [Planctomycetota bacterium]